MPCNQIIENAVDLGTCDRATLLEALKELGWPPTVTADVIAFNTEYGAARIDGGQVIMRGYGSAADVVRDKVKQAVMAKAIEKAGKKFGWNVTHDRAKNKVKLKR